MDFTLTRTEIGATVVMSLVTSIIYWYASNVSGIQRWLSVATAIVGTFVGAYAIFRVKQNVLEGTLTESDETRTGETTAEAVKLPSDEI